MSKRKPFTPFTIRRAAQLKTKSDQWYDDAKFLYKVERYAAAMYLGGFVVECLLKCALWKRRSEVRIRELLYRSHDLAELLSAATELDRAMRRDLMVYDRFVDLTSWNVRVRYNPARPHREDAVAFISKLKEVREWLRSRV